MRDRTPRRAGTNRCGPERSGDTDVSGTSGRVDKLWIICRLLSGTIRIRLEQSGSPMSITGLVFAAGCGLRGKYTAADTPLSRVLRSFSKKNGNPLPNAGKIGYLCLPEPAALPGLRTGPSGHRSGGPGPIRRTRTNLKRIADMKRLLLFCCRALLRGDLFGPEVGRPGRHAADGLEHVEQVRLQRR